MSVTTPSDSATTGTYSALMPMPHRADQGGEQGIQTNQYVQRSGLRASSQPITRTIIKWATYAGLAVLIGADLLALVDLMEWVPPQVHSVTGLLILFSLLEMQSRRRATDAVTTYQMGVHAGRIDQQREWLVVDAGVRPLPRELHQNVARRPDQRTDAAVLPFQRRYPPA